MGKRRWLSRFVFLLWMLVLQAVPAAAQPAPVTLSIDQAPVSLDGHSRYWIDDSAELDVAQVEARADSLPWALPEPGRQYAIDGRVLWFQFEVQSPGQNSHWFLELASSGLDRTVLYYRDPVSGQWITQEAGDSKAVSDWPLPGRFPTFELASTASRPVLYWLRIEHARVHYAAPMAIYSQSGLAASREREQLLLGAYFGLALLMGLVGAANAVAYRDRGFAAYALYVLALAAGQAAYLGLGAQYLWDPWLEWNRLSTFVLPALSSAAGLWFVRVVTDPGRYSAQLDRFVRALIAAQLLMTAVDSVLVTRTSLTLLMLQTVALLALVVGLIALVWLRGDDPSIRLIALGFLPVVLMALFPLARGFHLIPNGFFTRYGLSLGAALEIPILFYAMSLRGNRRREAQARARALARTDPLTGLTHSRILLLRLESALLRARRQGHACALLGVRLANFPEIAASAGREIAERALILAAARLRHVISDIDVASRVGEHQFALMLEGPATPDQALACATHVVARGLRESELLPGGVTLKFHVAVAMLPDASRNGHDSLQWLQAATHEMAQEPRKSIRAVNF